MNLIINSLLYITTFFIAKKRMGFCPFTFVWALYSIIAIMGVLIVQSGLYSKAFVFSTQEDVELMPYIFNYYCMLVVSLPLIYIKRMRLDDIQFPIRMKRIWSIVMWVFVFLIIIRLLELQMYGGMSFYERHYQITQEGNGINISQGNKMLSFVISFSNYFYRAVFPLSVLYLFYSLKKRLYAITELCVFAVICISPYLISYYISGNRSGMFFLAINLLFFFILFFRQLSKRKQKSLILIGIIFLSFLGSFAYSISQERFENSYVGVDGSILRYFGETFPNLGYQYWDNVKTITFGARQFTDYYELFTGLEMPYIGFDERFDFWGTLTGVDCALFKTLFGDLYIEFGTIGAFVFCTVLAFGIYLYVIRNEFNIYSLPIYYIYFCFCTNMVLDLPIIYTSISNMKTIMMMFLIGFCLKRINHRKNHYNTYAHKKYNSRNRSNIQ